MTDKYDAAARRSKEPQKLNEFQTKMKANLERIHAKVKEHTESTGGQSPILLLIRGTQLDPVDMQPYIDDKEIMAALIKAYQNQDDVDGTILITEAWVSTVAAAPDGGMPPEAEMILPSEDPDRKEVLFYLAETRQGNLAAQALMTREGDALSVGPLQIIADAEHKGRFVGGTYDD